jgi:hypothetical protein
VAVGATVGCGACVAAGAAVGCGGCVAAGAGAAGAIAGAHAVKISENAMMAAANVRNRLLRCLFTDSPDCPELLFIVLSSNSSFLCRISTPGIRDGRVS